MRITDDMLKANKERTEPTKEELSRGLKRVENIFTTNGWKETPLSKAVLPIIARRDMDYERNARYSQAVKGCAMIGNVGTGKTVLLYLCANLFDVRYFSLQSLSKLYVQGGEEAFWGKLNDVHSVGHDLILDDLGAEQDMKRYGNVLPIVDLIYERYERWKRSGDRLWMASNLNSKELTDRYGLRVVDRLKEMCVSVAAVGESLRK